MRILFVCTGNICRSPSAEGVLRQRVQAHGLAGTVVVGSCGTHGYHTGDPPDSRAMDVGRSRGYDLSAQRARAWRRDDGTAHDLIIGMEGHHADWVRQRLPDPASARVCRLLHYVPGHALRDVPDPYYGGLPEFEQMYDLIELGVDGLLNELRAVLADRR